jgi:hypothetical protein
MVVFGRLYTEARISSLKEDNMPQRSRDCKVKDFFGREVPCAVVLLERNGCKFVQLNAYDDEIIGFEEPLATLSSRIISSTDKETVYVPKTYSENTGLHEQLAKQGILTMKGSLAVIQWPEWGRWYTES